MYMYIYIYIYIERERDTNIAQLPSGSALRRCGGRSLASRTTMVSNSIIKWHVDEDKPSLAVAVMQILT